jgi:hypothetical protein
VADYVKHEQHAPAEPDAGHHSSKAHVDTLQAAEETESATNLFPPATDKLRCELKAAADAASFCLFYSVTLSKRLVPEEAQNFAPG